MARKDTLLFPIATDQSLAANFTTTPTIVRNLDNVAYQINVETSDSTGTFTVEASLDYAINDVTNVQTASGSWVTLPAGGSGIVNAADDTILVNLNQLPFNAVRLRYTSGSAGTGTCAIYIMAKQVGG